MGGRGANSDIQRIHDWLKGESSTGGGKVNPMDISKFKDYTLEQTEKWLRNLAHEELFAFDKDGNAIRAYKGNSKSVSFDADLLDVEGATVTHGHPKGMAEFGGTFSWADINNMLNSKWAEHRATASGQGEMNYIMRATAKANPKGLRRQINKDFPKIDAEWQKVYKDTYRQELDKGTPKAQAMHIARQKGVGVLNAYYKRTFSKFGYDYVTRKKEYQYNR